MNWIGMLLILRFLIVSFEFVGGVNLSLRMWFVVGLLNFFLWIIVN